MKSRVETNTKLVISVLTISCLVIPPNRDLMYVMWPVYNKTVFHYTQQISKSLRLDGYGELSTQPKRVLLCFSKKVLSGVWLSTYPGCQRLFMRGFRFRSSLKKWPARKVFSRGFAARVFGLRPNTCRPAADETKLPVAREKKPLVPRVLSTRQ